MGREALLQKASRTLPALAAAVLLTLSPVAPAQAASVISGPARVVDGDTLVINGTERIRLYGIDAPESKQSCTDPSGKSYSCGLRSKELLAQKVGSQVVTCEVRNQDQYGRNVAVCSIGGGPFGGSPEELNAWLAKNGLAVAYRQYGKQYVPLEEEARAEKRGVWAGNFTTPSEWRKQQKAGGAAPGAPVMVPASSPSPAKPPAASPAVPSAPSSTTCSDGTPALIKGNIGSKGAKIYHVPGGRSYDQVKIEVDSGERYFCTEAEAQAAGWRAASS